MLQNWKEMEFAFLQLCVFLILILVDVGTIVSSYLTSTVDKTIGYMAHLSGAIAGFELKHFIIFISSSNE